MLPIHAPARAAAASAASALVGERAPRETAVAVAGERLA